MPDKEENERLIGNVSDTAFWVAAYRALESERPNAAFHDPFARKLAGEKGPKIMADMPHNEMRAYVMTVRTLAIDKLVTTAIEMGVDTVINLGAGLDTRPYRLNLPAGLNWIEVDLPALIQYKNDTLKDEKPVCRLQRLSADLTDKKVRQAVFLSLSSQTKNVLIITEGLIPYLTNDQAAELAEDLHAVPNFQFWIMDYYRGNLKYRTARGMSGKMKNAPFQFTAKEPLDFFGGYGWTVKKNIELLDQANELGRPYPVPSFFRLMMRIFPRAMRKGAGFQPGYVLFERA
jgi:methyltransferase (TIGR00027 family)